MANVSSSQDLKKNDLFITCSQGLEPLLAEELEQLGCEVGALGFRGIYVKGNDLSTIYRINYNSRLGGRVLLPLTRFRCRDKRALYEGISIIDWQQYIPRGKTFAIDANVHHRELRNSLFAAQIAKDAICDQLTDRTGARPNIDTKNPDIQLNLYIDNELAVMSFDTSGAPLYKRGYRQETVEAPIQESLAAAILKLAQYKGDEILYDPCCGSGTILIESAMVASNTPPGYLRKNWGFMYLPHFSQTEWLKVKIESDQKRIPIEKGRLFGTDINKDAVRVCKTNLRAAGFHQAIEVTHYDFRDYTPPILPNLLISNPPHGNRLEEVQSLKSLYRDLGDFMKRNMAKPSRGFIFTGSLELTKEVGLAAKKRHTLNNSGIDSRLLEFDLY